MRGLTDGRGSNPLLGDIDTSTGIEKKDGKKVLQLLQQRMTMSRSDQGSSAFADDLGSGMKTSSGSTAPLNPVTAPSKIASSNDGSPEEKYKVFALVQMPSSNKKKSSPKKKKKKSRSSSPQEPTVKAAVKETNLKGIFQVIEVVRKDGSEGSESTSSVLCQILGDVKPLKSHTYLQILTNEDSSRHGTVTIVRLNTIKQCSAKDDGLQKLTVKYTSLVGEDVTVTVDKNIPVYIKPTTKSNAKWVVQSIDPETLAKKLSPKAAAMKSEAEETPLSNEQQCTDWTQQLQGQQVSIVCGSQTVTGNVTFHMSEDGGRQFCRMSTPWTGADLADDTTEKELLTNAGFNFLMKDKIGRFAHLNNMKVRAQRGVSAVSGITGTVKKENPNQKYDSSNPIVLDVESGDFASMTIENGTQQTLQQLLNSTLQGVVQTSPGATKKGGGSKQEGVLSPGLDMAGSDHASDHQEAQPATLLSAVEQGLEDMTSSLSNLPGLPFGVGGENTTAVVKNPVEGSDPTVVMMSPSLFLPGVPEDNAAALLPKVVAGAALVGVSETTTSGKKKLQQDTSNSVDVNSGSKSKSGLMQPGSRNLPTLDVTPRRVEQFKQVLADIQKGGGASLAEIASRNEPPQPLPKGKCNNSEGQLSPMLSQRNRSPSGLSGKKDDTDDDSMSENSFVVVSPPTVVGKSDDDRRESGRRSQSPYFVVPSPSSKSAKKHNSGQLAVESKSGGRSPVDASQLKERSVVRTKDTQSPNAGVVQTSDSRNTFKEAWVRAAITAVKDDSKSRNQKTPSTSRPNSRGGPAPKRRAMNKFDILIAESKVLHSDSKVKGFTQMLTTTLTRGNFKNLTDKDIELVIKMAISNCFLDKKDLGLKASDYSADSSSQSEFISKLKKKAFNGFDASCRVESNLKGKDPLTTDTSCCVFGCGK